MTHDRDAELRQTTERLYEVFGSYRADPKSIGVCPHCIHQEELDRLLAVPLRDLSAEELNPLASNAVKTHGEVDDLRYFLPRILELCVDGFDQFTDLEIIVNPLRFAEWHDWAEHEVSAVRAFLFSWWGWFLSSHPRTINALELLCAIAQVEDDLEPYLTYWHTERGSSKVALMHFVAAYHQECVERGHQDYFWFGSWWAERREQAKQAMRWLLSDDSRRSLQAARNEAGGASDQSQLAELALSHLDVWKARRGV